MPYRTPAEPEDDALASPPDLSRVAKTIAWCSAITAVAFVARPLLQLAIDAEVDATDHIAFLPDRSHALIETLEHQRTLGWATRGIHFALTAIVLAAFVAAIRARAPRRAMLATATGIKVIALVVFTHWLWVTAPAISLVGTLVGVLALDADIPRSIRRGAIGLVAADVAVWALNAASVHGTGRAIPWLEVVASAIVAVAAFGSARTGP